ncbi:hypothetical protein I7I50_01312 [Histoplasma capsulatum G186AR]|uniref:Uncharacterized protein n=1 Tax=Ajellomyces capsulatus TaxID=5037 RepID=A0A8H7Z041_AJECA|nr:hypothetical protein I7I52_08861 [Histoplasma capsulatum]QSS73222.1 hypothetical protein I7I50_01312 [Histoplasma capsulatum G186AR]
MESACQSACQPACQSACQPVCQSACQSVCQSANQMSILFLHLNLLNPCLYLLLWQILSCLLSYSNSFCIILRSFFSCCSALHPGPSCLNCIEIR